MTQRETPAPDHGEARERSLHLVGASNFRDLGGYGADTGRIVRWRTLFRSDNLAALTEPDAERFRALGVTRSFDFRGIRSAPRPPMRCPASRNTRCRSSPRCCRACAPSSSPASS